MASEIRVDKINSLSGVGTVTLSPTGVDIAGITTAATLRATTGIVTSLTAGSLTSLGAVSGTTGTFSGAVSGTTGTFSGAVSGTTGTFTGDVDIADKIVHTGDTNTTIRFPSADTITAETGGSERLRIDSGGKILAGTTSSRGVAGGYAKLQVEATSSEGVSITRTSADNGAVYLTLGKTRNGSACQGGDTIGSISWNPDDGTDLNHPAAEIQTVVASGLGGNDVPGDLIFKTNGGATSTTERLRITSAGNIGINANNPQNKLLVTDSGSVSLPVIQSHITDSNGGFLGYGLYSDINNKFTFTVSNNGRVTANDGIIFGSDTSTDNLLNDYEEGTWGPAPSDGNSTFSYGQEYGRYTKIGNVIHVTYSFNASMSGTSGYALFINLPFQVKDFSNPTNEGIGFSKGTGVEIQLEAQQGQSRMKLRSPSSGSALTPNNVGMTNNVTKEFRGAITYLTTS